MWANKDNSAFNSRSIFAFLRTNGEQNLICLCNFSSEKQSIKVKIPEHAFEFCNIKNAELLNFVFTDYFTHTLVNINGLELNQKGISFDLLSFGYAVYQF
jgi:predicted metal-binding protein